MDGKIEDDGLRGMGASMSDWADAGASGNLEALVRLVKVGDARSYDSIALKMAAEEGHLDAVKFLLPASDPRANNSESLRAAAINGHVEVMKLLLPVTDPFAFDSAALVLAVWGFHAEAVELLWAQYKGRESEFVGVLEREGMDAAPYKARLEASELGCAVAETNDAGGAREPIGRKILSWFRINGVARGIGAVKVGAAKGAQRKERIVGEYFLKAKDWAKVLMGLSCASLLACAWLDGTWMQQEQEGKPRIVATPRLQERSGSSLSARDVVRQAPRGDATCSESLSAVALREERLGEALLKLERKADWMDESVVAELSEGALNMVGRTAKVLKCGEPNGENIQAAMRVERMALRLWRAAEDAEQERRASFELFRVEFSEAGEAQLPEVFIAPNGGQIRLAALSFDLSGEKPSLKQMAAEELSGQEDQAALWLPALGLGG